MRLLSLGFTSIYVAGLLLTACSAPLSGDTVMPVTRLANPTSTATATAPLNLSPLLAFEQAMLSAVNTARAKGRQCGARSMPAVAGLTWNAQLQQAAFTHSNNMAKDNFFSHSGLDGKGVSQRVSDQGYHWRAVGENISAGLSAVATVMAGWLSSPGHCANIMSADFTEMAAARVTNNSAYYGSYWTQVFAASL